MKLQGDIFNSADLNFSDWCNGKGLCGLARILYQEGDKDFLFTIFKGGQVSGKGNK